MAGSLPAASRLIAGTGAWSAGGPVARVGPTLPDLRTAPGRRIPPEGTESTRPAEPTEPAGEPCGGPPRVEDAGRRRGVRALPARERAEVAAASGGRPCLPVPSSES
ncbi:hypothetical protein D9753_31845 [Streptomyces dangxiongensis]|uniref:Uncharacterized protein n=1 Tax=Streptomyces dangxiongensis TaxID=1442032 RepID=A0A3G2JJT8_9ACTN|nr:hypothetical protein D9753_31845 [Streptomyces dangxiongensis]